MTKAKAMIICVVYLFILTHICAFIFVYEREREKRKEKWREVARERRKKEEKVL